MWNMDRRTFLRISTSTAVAAGLGSIGCSTITAKENTPPLFPEDICEPSDGIHIRFLGTGAADWNGKDERGELRRFSSLLIDGRTLIDLTPDNLEMMPKGCRPHTIFYTHSHGDHYNPAAALQAGVTRVYLSETWLDIARKDFAKAAVETGIEMPAIIGVAIGKKYPSGNLSFMPLPANHSTQISEEQTLIWLIENKHTGTRLLYATDTGGIMSVAIRNIDSPQNGVSPLTGIIMESTMGIQGDSDFRLFTHSGIKTVQRTVDVLTSTGRYKPRDEKQPVFLTHMARTLHGTQAELDSQLPSPLCAAYDGMEYQFK